MLVKKIDRMVVVQEEKKLACVVNFLGEADDETAETIKKFGEKYRLKKVPLATTTDGDQFQINDAAEVTVMVYRGKKVKYNYALAEGGLDQKTIAAIVKNTRKMLKEPPEVQKAKPEEKAKPNEETKEEPKEQPKEEPKPPTEKDCPYSETVEQSVGGEVDPGP